MRGAQKLIRQEQARNSELKRILASDCKDLQVLEEKKIGGCYAVPFGPCITCVATAYPTRSSSSFYAVLFGATSGGGETEAVPRCKRQRTCHLVGALDAKHDSLLCADAIASRSAQVTELHDEYKLLRTRMLALRSQIAHASKHMESLGSLEAAIESNSEKGVCIAAFRVHSAFPLLLFSSISFAVDSAREARGAKLSRRNQC